MEYSGSGAYENREFFESFLKRRNRAESPNNVMEEPTFIQMMGTIQNGNILDLGCGDARFGLFLLNEGCREYHGVEGSANMYEKALEQLSGLNAKMTHSSLESFNFPENQYDLVISRMVLHYIEHLDRLFSKAYESLKPGGRFLFSVQHPVITSSFRSKEAGGERQDWIVDDYFSTGKRTEPWINSLVVKYHRTIEDYFAFAQKAGFTIETIREPGPSRDLISNPEEFNRRLRVPLFLLFACQKSIK
ncbi:class I SAM-dependent DNA methyltransferase [Bacillus sp. T33-2]|uniref:class I SAM-dependent DNA methyltransferase n=1 Tax=Bacillus sp. T33-2 TaxID=2054168 RepID=UPI000C75ABFD|nr:class I SAM-dependent methyltransferase [Bacillus sp. T33-2]PLR98803.1 SAM-dependent methyltransferase [Bacillus sp. T33-2]